MFIVRVSLIPAILLCLAACNSSNTREPSENTAHHLPTPKTENNTLHESSYSRYQSVTSEKTKTVDVADIQDNSDNNLIQPTDIWQRIRQNLVLARDLSRDSTKQRIEWYARNQEYLDRVVERAQPYIHYILDELEKRNMPLDLALLPIVESAYHPFAYSPSHASGIWQFIPGTGKRYGLKQNWWYDGRRDIIAATDAALTYLEDLNREFNGDWLLALAAYNSGEQRVGRAVASNKKSGKPIDFWALKLPRETRGYVPSLIAVAEIVANPKKYNIHLKPISNQPVFSIANIGKQIDLATAAELANLTMDEMYTLNPGFNRWATDPDGPHQLLIPLDKVETFKTNLGQLSEEQLIKWQQHEINKGDTLGGIALRYDTDVATLKQINHLRGNTIHAGQALLIPVASKSPKHYTLSLDARRYKDLKRSDDGKRYIYTVKRGDTLWDIGRHYGFSVTQLARWNGISSGSILRPGKKLTLWINSPENTQQDLVAVAAHPSAPGEQTHVSYTVKEGDSLWLISKRFGISVQQLQKWNSLKKRSILKPGQNLDIYLGKPPADA